MDNVCIVCHKSHVDEVALHKHLKAHQLTQMEYYQKYFPRYDKYDGQLIQFKNREFYLSADFNSKTNLAAWLKNVTENEARTYVKEFLSIRKQRKNLRFLPSQVELRSLPIPGMVYLTKLFGDYYKLGEDLGFEPRFNQVQWKKAPARFTYRHHILCDTREQQPLTFPTLVRNYEALKFGDYRLNDDDFTHHCCIERKALGDFYTTVSSGHIRFLKEIQRAEEAGFYLVVLVESSFDSIYSFPKNLASMAGVHIPHPEYVLYNMREICQQYDCVQFLFVENREDASRSVERIFRSDGEYKKVDLQYLYDTKQLI